MYKVSLLVPPESHRSKMSSTVCCRWKTSFLLWSSSFLETRARLNYIHYLGAIKPGNRWQMDKSSKGKRSSCSFVAVSQFGGIFSNSGLGFFVNCLKVVALSNQSASTGRCFCNSVRPMFFLGGTSVGAIRQHLSLQSPTQSSRHPVKARRHPV